MAYYEDEPTRENVARILADANDKAIPVWMNVVNVGEVWCIIARKTLPADADEAVKKLQKIGIQIDNAEWKLARQAAMFKSKHKISYSEHLPSHLQCKKCSSSYWG